MQLTTRAVYEYWENKDPKLYKLMKAMAGAETWSLDEMESDAWLVDLSDALGSQEVAQQFLENQRAVIELTVYLSSPFAIRILSRVDELGPGVVQQLIKTATDDISKNPVYQTFLERLEVISRERLLAEIFSPERFKAISDVIAQRDRDQ